MKVGVLALQGGVVEHIGAILSLGHEAIEVKKIEDLQDINALILPGGESTTMGILLRVTGLLDALKEKINGGLPVWGTCAGMILLAKNIEDEDKCHLGVMDITVRRNAYGSQINSFNKEVLIKDISNSEIELVFIRAPFVRNVGKEVKVIAKVDNNIVAVGERNMLVTSFHPELTKDNRFLKYFLEKIA